VGKNIANAEALHGKKGRKGKKVRKGKVGKERKGKFVRKTLPAPLSTETVTFNFSRI